MEWNSATHFPHKQGLGLKPGATYDIKLRIASEFMFTIINVNTNGNVVLKQISHMAGVCVCVHLICIHLLDVSRVMCVIVLATLALACNCLAEVQHPLIIQDKWMFSNVCLFNQQWSHAIVFKLITHRVKSMSLFDQFTASNYGTR